MEDNLSTKMSERVMLFFNCLALKDMDTFSKSDPQLFLYERNSNLGSAPWRLVGKTEMIDDNLNPDFATPMELNFHFESHQYLKFVVVDIDDKATMAYEEIGTAYCELATLLTCAKYPYELTLTNEKFPKENCGTLQIKFEKISSFNTNYYVQVSCTGLRNVEIFGETDPFLKFFRPNNIEGLPDYCDPNSVGIKNWVLVYQTEEYQNNLNPVFKQFSLSGHRFCHSNPRLPMLCEVWDWESNGSHRLVGSLSFIPEQVLNGQLREFTFVDKKLKPAGKLRFLQARVDRNIDFIDYLMNGVNLIPMVAIDFTGSNGDYVLPSSLHFNNPMSPNQYQQSIFAVCSIILQYLKSPSFPVYGFGAEFKSPNIMGSSIPNWNTKSDCFPMNLNWADAEVPDLNALMMAYGIVLPHLKLSGPTHFGTLITQATNLAVTRRNESIMNYTILIILTDGEIHDMRETVSKIVEATSLPLSIIIIGVGNESFKNMKVLDGDDFVLTDVYGRKAARDIVQFVPFSEFKHNVDALAAEVLAEIPRQMNQYYKTTPVYNEITQKLKAAEMPRTSNELPQMVDNRAKI